MGKLFLKSSLYVFAVISCLVISQKSSGQEFETWQKDWQAFGVAIAPFAQDGALERKSDIFKFNRIFSKDVEWSGTVKRVYDNSVAKTINLEMKPIQVTLSNGSLVEGKELSIYCTNNHGGCERWSQELVGKDVTFRTKLVNRTRGYLPVVRLLGDGDDRLIYIETRGAVLIRVE